uniref:Uncharacterized protein n=1 Tax=Vespula pensylvanica TaxID=30213 RepID=A0A834UDP3_VESPE|nr:hypothetical protein H0235_005257 [Vespula pensylvanica]
MNTTNIIDPLPNKEPYDDLTGKTYGVRRSRGGSYENVRFTVACPFSMEKKQDTKGVRRSEVEKEEGEEEDEEDEEEEEEEEFKRGYDRDLCDGVSYSLERQCVASETLEGDRSISEKSMGVTTMDEERSEPRTILTKLRKIRMSCIEIIKRIYHEICPRRVIGFRCDIRKCTSTLLECSMGPCKKDIMVFEVIDQRKIDPNIISQPFTDDH